MSNWIPKKIIHASLKTSADTERKKYTVHCLRVYGSYANVFWEEPQRSSRIKVYWRKKKWSLAGKQIMELNIFFSVLNHICDITVEHCNSSANIFLISGALWLCESLPFKWILDGLTSAFALNKKMVFQSQFSWSRQISAEQRISQFH